MFYFCKDAEKLADRSTQYSPPVLDKWKMTAVTAFKSYL